MKVSEGYEQLIGYGKQLLDQLADVNTPSVADLKEKVGRVVDGAQSSLKDKGARAAASARAAALMTDDYVRESPWTAILATAVVAATVGFIAGATISREK